MLTEQEWKNISNILLELYTLKNINELSARLLRALRILIPYTKGYFLFLDENCEIIGDYTECLGFEKKQLDEYLSECHSEDCFRRLSDSFKETTVYSSAGMVSEDMEKSESSGKKNLPPFDIPHSSGILIFRNEKICAVFNLFRSDDQKDFTEKDIFILEILKDHLKNMIENSFSFQNQENSRSSSEENFVLIEKKFALTNRETEILRLLSHGKSNMDIADELCVSLSTIKKHIYNLYTKTKVSSRTQLLNLIYN